MTALCTRYGLSQSPNADNKELIFVKLTDSAFRAIEEYNRNRNKLNSGATIQLSGNEGCLFFPTVAANGNGGQKFSFSITEFEGSQGSFEMVQQSQGRLEAQGQMSNKMHIHANDDVYETTKHRMAVAEENQKNKCTREIKPNQTDIGRRVKLKTPMGRLSNIPSSNNGIISSSTISNSSSSSSSSAAAAATLAYTNGGGSNSSSSINSLTSTSVNNLNNSSNNVNNKQRDSYLINNNSSSSFFDTKIQNGKICK